MSLKSERIQAALEEHEFILELAKCNLDTKPGKNWIERQGGLPRYVHEIACSILESNGGTIEKAIRIALNRIRVWAGGGGGVSAKTQAKASKALAEWEKMRAKAKSDNKVATSKETPIEKIIRLTK